MLGRSVEDLNVLPGIGHDDGIRGGLQQLTQLIERRRPGLDDLIS